MHWCLFVFPVLATMIAFTIKKHSKLDVLVILHAVLHLGLGINGFMFRDSLGTMDDLGLFVFLITSVLYLAVAIYRYNADRSADYRSYRIQTICLMLFIAAMDGACIVQDFGLIWIFVEATTLASAMLISADQKKSSMEAAWKYLFICSVGIALAFVGILFLVIAQTHSSSLNVRVMLDSIATISPFWLKMAFVFIMVGFGTKIGLAPLHFWLPDAHSEAPAPVSALLSGALLNTALIPILRMDKLLRAAGLGSLAKDVYLLMGFLSVFIATVFILRTKNYKRLLAYSSIENMGLIMIAFGTGGIALYAGYMHILGHSLIKAAFFLTAGNIVTIYNEKNYENISGLLSVHKPSAWLWLLAFAMIIGMPPSPLFISEFLIITALIEKGYLIGVIALLVMLVTIAACFGKVSLQMCMGNKENKANLNTLRYLVPSMLLLGASIIGVWLPIFD